MLNHPIAPWLESVVAIGLELRVKWLRPRFYAILALDVPRQTPVCSGLPITAEEWGRAQRYKHVMDRNRSLVAWSALRVLLGVLFETQPELVEIARTVHGKPLVPDGPSISISHSGELAVIALSSALSIGVDIEAIKDSAVFAPAVLDTLTKSELAYFSDRTGDAAFLLRAWTRKEATAKVLGAGLSFDFRSLSVLDGYGCRFKVLFHQPDGQVFVNGIDLDLRDGYIAALASTQTIPEVATYLVAANGASAVGFASWPAEFATERTKCRQTLKMRFCRRTF
ncbi:4'-phosphopantetheinyl transferase family protein [Phyllobacterium sophorae]|uniref:4-phosphopantetheinyl transferase n=1 Tax=Phyllobacterium sophorae TaxID=1520277 RepID=A0A2P7B6T7_9HYPH|nr:4-phosphopantetheinyl transferase [Phyllobacterium sophorae]